MEQAARIRMWAYVGLFGALWGAVEMTLGSALHLIFPPLANTFLVGLIMTSIACVIALTGRFFVPKRGSVVLIGLIAALLKALGPGAVKIGPMIAIMAESLLMEAVLALRRAPGRWLYVAAGMLAVSWNFFHRFVMMGLLYGRSLAEVALKMSREGDGLLGLDERRLLPVLAALLAVRMACGALSGLGAWSLGKRIRRRVQREPG
jgi:ABC-type thiamin/hydroxymethylpyrimidine transport system permease subunit